MSLKSWGFELWDQADKVFLYTNQGVEQVDTFFRLVSDIHKIYSSLAKKYKNLSIPASNKTKLVLESSSYVASLGKIYQNMADQSSVFDNQVDEIKNQVLLPIKTFLDSSKSTIKEQTNELVKFKQRLEKSKASLDLAWTKYFGAYMIKKRAEAAYNRVKDDKTIPRVDIEKFQGVSQQKISDLEKVKSDYASCLQQFNKDRGTLYLKDLPKIFSELEMVDRIRAEVTLEAGLALVKIQETHLGKTGECNASFGEAIKMIDFKADSRLLVDNKTSLLLPPEFVFVDLAEYRNDTFNPSDFPGLLQQGGKIEKNDSAKSLFSVVGLKGIEIKDMLQSQVKCKLDEISSIIPMVEKELVGLKTLFDSYRKDPSMGDKAKLDPQIDTNERKLNSLKEMQEMINLHYQSTYGSKNSTQTNVMTKKPSVANSPDSDEEGSFDEDDEEDFDSHEPPLSGNTKMATVLYSFESTDPQQLTVESGQKVTVVNYDDGGTGWTLIQQVDNASNKGYVPTNYIQLL